MDELHEKYFDWLCGLIEGEDVDISQYGMLLQALFMGVFTYTIKQDSNRAEDGIALRHQFSVTFNDKRRCSVLEMMIALAIRCESIMEGPDTGDMTPVWFWSMIDSLGLMGMTNDNYDESFIILTIGRFLDRGYQPNGKGGLFTVERTKIDMRRIEIWYQMMAYLDEYLAA